MKRKVLLSFLIAMVIFALYAQPDPKSSEQSQGISMILVPAGSFQRNEEEENVSIITKAFYISQYQITRKQFLLIMGKDPSDKDFSTGLNDPVQNINWYQAIAFCNMLSIADGLEPVYSINLNNQPLDWKHLTYKDIPHNINKNDSNWDAVVCNWDANGYRLPTVAEWTWAAIGAPVDGQNGSINRDGYKKAFAGQEGDNEIDAYVWYDKNSYARTHPVGQKLPNELGIYDMSGNAQEWCWDWYGKKLSGSLGDYTGASTGEYRQIRGGSWENGISYAAPGFFMAGYPAIQHKGRGFRIVRPYSDK